ncbi:UDP-N-acetylenolpyruvoylglucosamine reductase, partial [Pseudomonas sp. GP01-A3]
GGPADYLVIPKNVNEIKDIIQLAKEHNINVTVIGRGSNLLVSDKGIEGIVIKISDCLDHIEIDGTKVLVGAGYSVIRLATQLSRKGLSGLE